MDLNKIYNLDCYEGIKAIPDKSVDLIYTDPPYLFNGGGGGTTEMAKQIVAQDSEIKHISSGFDFALFEEFRRVLKHTKLFIWCSEMQIKPLLDYWITDDKMRYKMLVWCKTNAIPACNGKWLSDIEYCLYIHRVGETRLNDGYDLKSKFHVSPINQQDKAMLHHPTIKPLPLVTRHILHTTQSSDIVLDPFIGSGTTAVACQETGRQFIGFEIDKKYCDIANNRLNKIDANGQHYFTAF